MPTVLRLLRRWLLPCVSVLWPMLVAAQPNSDPEAGRLFTRQFAPRDYRGPHAINAITQGADGVIYVGGADAVLAFDGASWSRFELPGAVVRGIAAAPDGSVFVAADGGFQLLRRDVLGRLVLTALEPPDALRGIDAWSPSRVFRGRDEFRVATDGRALMWDGAWREHPIESGAAPELHATGESLLVRVPGAALYEWREGAPERIPAPRELLTSRGFFAARDERGLFVCIEDGRLFRFVAGQWAEDGGAKLPLLSEHRMLHGLQLKSGVCAYATTEAGTFVPLPNGQAWRIDQARGLIDININALCEDAAGGLWLGTNFGLARVDLPAAYSVFLRNDGIERTQGRAMARWNGRFVLAQDYGVYGLTPAVPALAQPAVFEPLPFPPAVRPRALFVVEDALHVASNFGLQRLRGGAVVETLFDEPLVTALPVPNSGVILGFGAAQQFLLTRETQGWSVRRAPRVVGDFEQAAWDEEGTLWLASGDGGIVALRASGRGWPEASIDRSSAPPSRGGKPVAGQVVATRDGPRFATNAGLFRRDRVTGRWENDPRGTAWATGPEIPRALHVQDDGFLWVQLYHPGQPGRSRLVRVTPAGAVDRVVASEPVELVEYGGVRLLFAERVEGREMLWASGTGGLIRCDWSGPPPPRPAFPPIVSVEPDSAPIATEGRPVFAALSRRPLRFTFGLPLVQTGAAWEYETRLVGFDDAWSRSPRADAVFTNLPGGAYTFEVRARHADGNVSPPARLSFLVRPPWHRSTPAYIGYLLLGLAAIGGLMRWRLRLAERERLRLEEIVARRTTELRAAKEEADAANRAKTLFLANMSHELRTPLNAILGYSQLLRKDDALPTRHRERVGIINESGEHLLTLINDVLDLAKIEAGRMELRLAAFDLGAFLRAIAAAHEVRARGKALEFATEFGPGLPCVVEGDEHKLRQVLDNLLANAVKFTPNGRVTFAVDAPGGAVDGERTVSIRFSVSDTGVGIGAADRERVFELFAQAGEGRPQEPGTGLGLPLCRRLLALMGASLELESEPGRGTRFQFTLALPVGMDAAVHPMADRMVGYQGRRLRVLVVDDIAANRSLLRDLLEPLGFQVEEAATGEEALAKVAAGEFDAVLLDLRLPDIDGLTVAARIRDRRVGERPKIIALSAGALTTDRASVRAAGGDEFLAKPFRDTELLAALGGALGIDWIKQPPLAEPARDGGEKLGLAALQELLGYAREGQIVPLRERLAAFRASCRDPLLEEVVVLTNAFQLARLCRLLEAALVARSTA